MAFFFTWGALGNFYQAHLDKTQLLLNEGEIATIDIIFEQGSKPSYSHNPLIISLFGYEKTFRVRDNFKDWFPILKEKIQKGDKVKIYTRTKIQTIFGWGRQNDIFLIEKNNEPLLPLSIIADYNSDQATLLALFSLIFWTVFVLYKLKIIKPT